MIVPLIFLFLACSLGRCGALQDSGIKAHQQIVLVANGAVAEQKGRTQQSASSGEGAASMEVRGDGGVDHLRMFDQPSTNHHDLNKAIDCATKPGSVNSWSKIPDVGCAGAKTENGKFSRTYCENIEGRTSTTYKWYTECCLWKREPGWTDGECVEKDSPAACVDDEAPLATWTLKTCAEHKAAGHCESHGYRESLHDCCAHTCGYCQPTMTQIKYKNANARCDVYDETTNRMTQVTWGNFGTGTEEDCKQACLTTASCQFAVFTVSNGKCTQFRACSKTVVASAGPYTVWTRNVLWGPICPSDANCETPGGLQCCSKCKNGYALNAATLLCKACPNGKYLTIDGSCLEECPPGSYKDDSTGVQECTICEGSTRRRGEGSKCTPCPNGHIGKPNFDSCQNFQNTCELDQCNSCLACLNMVEPHLQKCWERYNEAGLRHNEGSTSNSNQCINFDEVWCPEFVSRLENCVGFSLGCYYKLLCHDIRVCPEWKAVKCGGSETNALLQADLSASLSKRENRAGVNETNGLHSTTDSTLTDKCTG